MTPAIRKLRKKYDKLEKELVGEKTTTARKTIEEEMMNIQEEIEHKLSLIKLCSNCEEPIQPERLEIFPYTEYCVKCVDIHGPKIIKDPEELCAKANTEGRNGFSNAED